MSTDDEERRLSLASRRTGAVGTALLETCRVALPVATFLAVIAVVLATTPATANASVRGIVVTTDTAALEVAGKSTLGVLGYVDFATAHVYVTAESALAVAAGSVLAARGGVGTLAGVVLGAIAAGMPILVIGCPCGSGMATPLWQFVGS